VQAFDFRVAAFVHHPLRFVSYSINSYSFNQFIQEIKQPPVRVTPEVGLLTLAQLGQAVLKFGKFNKERIMSLKDRAKATAKNIEGKVQEALGDLTGDPKDQAEGKAKQAEAKARHIVEDVKDEVKKIID
jgi:uncharacterized protein YjbJ (UPF0337 family)